MSLLAGLDLSLKLDESAYKARVLEEQLRLRQLHFRMYEEQVPLLALFEGSDAAGKGGAIKRITLG